MTADDRIADAGAWDHVSAYDAASQRPTEAVLQAVMATTGRDPFVGEPLYSVVDPDALDSLICGDRRDDVGVTFSYLGCFVHVDCESVRVRQNEATGME